MAGIAVVAALLVVGLALGWYFWYQRRKRSLGGKVAQPQQYMDGKPPYQAVPQQHAEAFGKQPEYQVHRVEGHGGSPYPAEAGSYVGGEFNPNANGIAELANTAR